ncbi:D-Ala-D-Ala carboxypeptidase family metallohydrolase [Citromicrobium bathyomarinum]
MLLIAALAICAGLVWVNRDALFHEVSITLPHSASRTAFDRWLEEGPEDEPDRAERYARFSAFLAEEGVGDVIEPWQLSRLDAYVAERCETDVFAIPPEDLWPNIVPALRLVRDEVVPALGPVTVLSSWRNPATNVCAGGASRSNHLQFAALDLATQPRRTDASLYRDLCAMHDAAGRASPMGLGAYYDPVEGEYSGGRFHIDAQGYRDWGRQYTSASSPCGTFD